MKSNLILSLVYRVRCLEHGKFAIDLILDEASKKKIDITLDEVMSSGGDWWRGKSFLKPSTRILLFDHRF